MAPDLSLREAFGLALAVGQIGLDDLPDAIVIYVVVTVDENVSESDNPTEFRVSVQLCLDRPC